MCVGLLLFAKLLKTQNVLSKRRLFCRALAKLQLFCRLALCCEFVRLQMCCNVQSPIRGFEYNVLFEEQGVSKRVTANVSL